jgi:hypothetical protein
MEAYWKAITVIEAQDTLMQLRTHDWPNMKKADRKKFHRKMHEMAYPQVHDDEPLTTEQLAARIRGALNG